MIWVNVSLAHHFYAGLSADDGVTIEVVVLNQLHRIT